MVIELIFYPLCTFSISYPWKSDNTSKDLSRALQSFLRDLITYFSMFGVYPSIRDINILSGIRGLKITIGYVNYLDEARKVMILRLLGRGSESRSKRGDEWGFDRFVHLIRECALSLISPIACDIITVGDSRYMEYTHPMKIKQTHEELKKVIKAIDKSKYEELCRNFPHLKIDVSRILLEDQEIRKILAFSIMALLSGAHRNGIAIRQVASQWILWKIAEIVKDIALASKRGITSTGMDVGILGTNELLKILYALIADTYLWLSHIGIIRVKFYGVETHYSVAAVPLATLYQFLKSKIERDGKSNWCEFSSMLKSFLSKSPSFMNEMFSSLCCYLKMSANKCSGGCMGNDFSMYADIIGEIAGKTKVFLQEFFKEFFNNKDFSISSDTLLGRFSFLTEKIKRVFSGEKKKFNVLITTATEQYGPAQAYLLLELLNSSTKRGSSRLIVLYTQLSYWNRLLVEDALRCRYSTEIKECTFEYYPISPSNPYLTLEIVKKIFSSLKEQCVLMILQGQLNIVLPAIAACKDMPVDRYLVLVL